MTTDGRRVRIDASTLLLYYAIDNLLFRQKRVAAADSFFYALPFTVSHE